MAEPDRTNADAERVSDIVAALPRWNFAEDTMEPADDGTYVYFEDVADIIEAQSKALAEARAVKPLEWHGTINHFEAVSILGRYSVKHDGDEPDEWSVSLGSHLWGFEPTEDAAKARAEGHLKRAILSALTPTPENPNG